MNDRPKTLGTRELLDNVALNLYRHRLIGVYYGRKKVAGKIRDRALETSDARPLAGRGASTGFSREEETGDSLAGPQSAGQRARRSNRRDRFI